MKSATSISAFFMCMCLFVGCSQVEKRRQHSLSRLDGVGGNVHGRYVRKRLVSEIQKATPNSLETANLISAVFYGDLEQKKGGIVVDWISAQPLANGLVLNMKDGSLLFCKFHCAWNRENKSASKDLIIFQASVHKEDIPNEWQNIDFKAIDSGQLTKVEKPIGNKCKFRLVLKKKSPEKE